MCYFLEIFKNIEKSKVLLDFFQKIVGFQRQRPWSLSAESEILML